MSRRAPVTLLTGFLGSGKTTLLNRALKEPALARTAVVVNEFGEIGLDHELVEASDDRVVLLENGCLCCAVKGDLVRALDSLQRERLKGTLPPFDRVVVETSGLAEPTPVIEVLLSEPTIAARYALDGVCTTVDAVVGEATLAAHLESAQQVALADRIVVTKTDLAPPGAADALAARLRALNATAPIADAAHAATGASLLLAPSPADDTQSLLRTLERIAAAPGPRAALPAADGRWRAVHAARADDERIRSVVFVRDEPMPMRTLERFLEALSSSLGPELLRVKGLVHVAERPQGPAVVHGAQQLLHGLRWLPAWPSDDRRTRIVFIALASAAARIDELYALVDRMTRVR